MKVKWKNGLILPKTHSSPSTVDLFTVEALNSVSGHGVENKWKSYMG